MSGKGKESSQDNLDFNCSLLERTGARGILFKFPTTFQVSTAGLKPDSLETSLSDGTRAQGIIRVNIHNWPDPDWI
ncbi:unnamed protein product [Leuciscus chuanchicus]